MPFLKLNNDWSNLANFYNQNFSNKPKIPAIRYVNFDDGLIRGGVLNVGISAIRDTARIGKFYASAKGASFLIKQVGLQKANPELEQLPDSRRLSASNTRLYNLGGNTLAQVPINALGGHIIRHGITPRGGVGFLEGSSLSNIDGYNYEKIASTNAGLITDNASNRTSIALKNNRLLQYLSYYQGNPNPKGPNGGTYSPDDTTPMLLREYKGGANSVYGLGTTQIFSTTVRTDLKTTENNQNFEGLTYQGLKEWFDNYRSKVNGGDLNLDPNNQVFINNPNNPPKEVNSLLDSDFSVYQGIAGNILDGGIKPIDSYALNNIQSRIGVSTSKFGPNNIKTNYKVDAINVINVTKSNIFYDTLTGKKVKNTDVNVFENKAIDEKLRKKVSGYFGRDIIKFRIEFLDNNATTELTDVLAFRAYINDFSDGMNAKWDSYRYMGRGEDFYVYNGFTRDISVDFTIFAHSPEEMRPIYQKLNYLLSSFAPDYNEFNKMRGNIGYLTVGDYLYRQPGVFTDIKLSGMLDSHWEIALNDPEGDPNDTLQYEIPKHIKVNLSFKPIHNFLPRKVQDGKFDKSPFITPNEKNNKYLTAVDNTQSQTQNINTSFTPSAADNLPQQLDGRRNRARLLRNQQG